MSPAQVEEWLADTLPTPDSVYLRNRLDLASKLKALTPDLEKVRPVVEVWHQQAEPIIQEDFATFWAAFAKDWKRVKYVAGQRPIDQAFRKALKRKVPARVKKLYKDDPTMHRLALLCAQLQEEAGAEPFYLTCRTAGRLLGIHFVKANDRLRMLVTDKILKLEERGQPRRASRYHYLPDDL
jgi:hypothetical protein